MRWTLCTDVIACTPGATPNASADAAERLLLLHAVMLDVRNQAVSYHVLVMYENIYKASEGRVGCTIYQTLRCAVLLLLSMHVWL